MWKRLLAIILVMMAVPASAALTSYPNLTPAVRNMLQNTSLFVKGNADNNLYLLEVDPATGALPVSGSFSLANDTNYGVVGANTLRTAAQIGNFLGAADWGVGNSTAQTLRAVLATNQPTLQVAGPAYISDAAGNALTSTLGALNVNLASGASLLATAAKQDTGNTSLSSIDGKTPALGQALMASSSPVVIASNQSAIPVSGTFWQATQPVSGTVAVSNLPTTADTNAGAAGSSTLREVAAGRSLTTVVGTYAYSGGSVTTSAYTQVIASTSAAITRLHVYDNSGSSIIVATGAGGAEVDRIYLPPGGSPFPYEVTIPASTRISIKALDIATGTTGAFIVTGLQ